MEEPVLDFDFYYNTTRALTDMQLDEIPEKLDTLISLLTQLLTSFEIAKNFVLSIVLPLSLIVGFLWWFFKQFLYKY